MVAYVQKGKTRQSEAARFGIGTLFAVAVNISASPFSLTQSDIGFSYVALGSRGSWVRHRRASHGNSTALFPALGAFNLRGLREARNRIHHPRLVYA